MDASAVPTDAGASTDFDMDAESYRDELSAPKLPTLRLQDFKGADSCKSCHPTHYAEWKQSSHAYAMKDPVYRALVHRQRLDRGTSQDLFCTQCHTAVGTRTGDVFPGFSFDELKEVSQEGVTCEGCHRVTSIERTHNSGHVITPSAPLQGPFSDSVSPHPTAQSSILGSAQFCGGCHDVRDPSGIVLESPLVEWLTSPAAAQGKACQSCHMPTYPGTASSLPGAPSRAALHRHTFTGVEVPLAAIGELPEKDLSVLREQSEHLLHSAVELELQAAAPPAAAGVFEFRAVVKNRIDGHNFPTGSSFNRQFWLAVEVLDAKGTLLFESGGMDGAGDLFDRHHPRGATVDPVLVTFGSQLEDGDGEPTLFSWLVAKVRNSHVLPPLGTEEVPYRFALPPDAMLPLTVHAKIRFRAFAPRLLRELALDHLLSALEIVDLAQKVVVFD